MAKQTIINGESGLSVRNKLNSNFTEVYDSIASVGSDVASIDVTALSGNWQNTFTTVQSNSATWGLGGNGTDTGVRALTSNWESTYTSYSANSASFATTAFTDSKYLPLTGGTITGLISSTNSVYIDGLVEIGTGTGVTTLFVGQQSVGINTETPNEALTVVGNISATGTIYANNVNSTANFLPLSGGTVTGNLTAVGNVDLASGYNTTTLFVSQEKVGINTIAPTEDLTVIGNAFVSGSVSTNNIRIGNSETVSGFYGTITRKIEIFDQNGVSLGFLPIYNSID